LLNAVGVPDAEASGFARSLLRTLRLRLSFRRSETTTFVTERQRRRSHHGRRNAGDSVRTMAGGTPETAFAPLERRGAQTGVSPACGGFRRALSFRDPELTLRATPWRPASGAAKPRKSGARTSGPPDRRPLRARLCAERESNEANRDQAPLDELGAGRTGGSDEAGARQTATTGRGFMVRRRCESVLRVQVGVDQRSARVDHGVGELAILDEYERPVFQVIDHRAVAKLAFLGFSQDGPDFVC